MESEPKETPFYQKFWGGLNPWRCIKQDSEPNTLLTELFQPPSMVAITYQFLITSITQPRTAENDPRPPSLKVDA